MAWNKREQRRTGGWSLPASAELTPIDYNIEGIIGEMSISGVEGGIDVPERELISNETPIISTKVIISSTHTTEISGNSMETSTSIKT